MSRVYSVDEIGNVNRTGNILIVDNGQPASILLIGGCRITATLNFLLHDEEHFGTRYNYLCVLLGIHEMRELGKSLQENEKIKAQIRQATHLIAEHCENYHYWNTVRTIVKPSIFHIHDAFEKHVCLPNWYISIYTKDILNKKNKMDDFLRLQQGDITLDEFTTILREACDEEWQRYEVILRKSGFEDLILFFSMHRFSMRFAFTWNHPCNVLFLQIYQVLLRKLCGADALVPDTVRDLSQRYEFLSSDTYYTKLTWYDRHCLGLHIKDGLKCVEDREESNSYLLDPSFIHTA